MFDDATLKTSWRVAAIIPALNEAASITRVVRAVRPFAQPVVVDDGSTDATGALAREAGAEVVRHGRNRGYDCALESGLRRALELGFDAAVTLDADGQHDPALLQQFIAALIGGADLVVGVRDKPQRWSEALFALIARYFWNLRDPLCGMKGYRADILRRAGQLRNYESIGTELVLRAARSDCEIVQLPVPTYQRADISRFGKGFRANVLISRALLRGLVDTSRIGKKV